MRTINSVRNECIDSQATHGNGWRHTKWTPKQNNSLRTSPQCWQATWANWQATFGHAGVPSRLIPKKGTKEYFTCLHNQTQKSNHLHHHLSHSHHPHNQSHESYQPWKSPTTAATVGARGIEDPASMELDAGGNKTFTPDAWCTML